MSESDDHFIEVVVSLAGSYRSQEDLSIYEMLKRTGYFQRRKVLTIEAIRKALTSAPERMGEWLEYSADKRSDEGWYLQSVSGRFEVGKRRRDGSTAEQKSYSDLEDACGYFILHELDQIASEQPS